MKRYRNIGGQMLSNLNQTQVVVKKKQKLRIRILKHWEFYLLLIPGILLTIIFKYIPMYGLQIAFRDFNAGAGFFGSEWVGLKWFTKFFTNYNSIRMIQNTVLLSLYSLLWSFPIPIILALMLNQVKHKKFQKTVQTVVYAPHFISIMVLCGMLKIFLSPYGGLFNVIGQAFGGGAVDFLGEASSFRTIYVASGIWQDAGWGTILYLATLSGVDTELYDAAKVDGAGTLKRILHIDFPTLLPIIIIQLIMSFGSLMNVGFEKAFLLQTKLNAPASEIIATYVYKQGILKAQYSFSTAVGLFNTAINLILLLVVSRICRKASDIRFL
jgi:putative aldouronate transport system permease protein